MISRNIWRSGYANFGLVIMALVVVFVLMEIGAQFYAYKIAKHGKLFRPDAELGWVLLPNNEITRLNHDREPWVIRTNEQGLRGPGSWPDDAGQRLLVVGDSFAFGEGVDIEKRFDTLIAGQIADLAYVNLGVMGYGTDQEFLSARHWTDQLRAGDILLVLTYGNDFFDIASTHQSGRSKPWFEQRGGELMVHKPKIGLLEIARDRSYLFSLVASRLNIDSPREYDARLKQAGQLYQEILARMVKSLVQPGVEIVLVHHGDDVYELPFDVDGVYTMSCRLVTSCLALDPVIARHERHEVFLSDGHWNEGGHRIAAEEIVRHLRAQQSRSQPGNAVLAGDN